MNSFGGAVSAVPVILYLLVLGAAAASDVVRFRIPNVLPTALVGLFIAVGFIVPVPVDWGSHLAAVALALLLGSLLFAAGKWGGGDAKLLGAVALWSGLPNLVDLLVSIALSGGGLALVLLVSRHWARSWIAARPGAGALPRVLKAGEGVPYGLAIAVGGALVAPDLAIFAL